MRKHNKKGLVLSIVILFILFIGVGYSFLTTKLNINGTAITKANTWDIHFNNVQVKDGSVTSTAPTINTAKDTVTYSVTLPLPGDYYEFTVDVVNAGTIDGMIDVINNSNITTEQAKYFTFDVSYEDGSPILKNDLLSKGATETIKLIVKYRNDKDMQASDIPSSDQTFNITFGITYVQATSAAVAIRSTLDKTKFKSFAKTNTPTEIIFTNTGSTTGIDVSETQDGSILAWMDSTTMYVSRNFANRYVYAPIDCSSLFASGNSSGWQSNLISLDLSKLNTSNVNNMDNVFQECINLVTIDFTNFDTSNVISMKYMFYECKSLTTLDFTCFDTSNVTTMYYMFTYCSKLTMLDLSYFDTSNVIRLDGMFNYCSGLIDVDISSFNTSKVTNMSCMFYCCNSLTELNVSNFDTSSVTDMSGMFYECKFLTSLNLSYFDTSQVTDIASMFYKCESLSSLDISGFNMSKITDIANIFDYCNKLTLLIIPATNGNGIDNTNDIIYGSTTSTLYTLTMSGRTVTLK